MADWVILGGQGMLGTEISNLLAGKDYDALSREDCDITNFEELRDTVSEAKYIINCAAFTAVDDAETNEQQAFEINAVGARNSAKLAMELKAKLVYVSTDYVFPGDAASPYQEDAPTGPMSAYGRTKLAGENEIKLTYPENSFIVRTAWLYGQHGPNFVKTMVALEKQKDSISVVDDQIGQPTWTFDLGKKIIELLESAAIPGTYHGTSGGQTSWFNFARRIFEHIGADPERVQPTTSEQFVRPAKRPSYSVLGHKRWLENKLSPIRNWQEGLEAAINSECCI